MLGRDGDDPADCRQVMGVDGAQSTARSGEHEAVGAGVVVHDHTPKRRGRSPRRGHEPGGDGRYDRNRRFRL
jgi:hypothetical protein